MVRHQFDLSGGHLALDFANTMTSRHKPEPRERLTSYDELVAFAEIERAQERQHARVGAAHLERDRDAPVRARLQRGYRRRRSGLGSVKHPRAGGSQRRGAAAAATASAARATAPA